MHETELNKLGPIGNYSSSAILVSFSIIYKKSV